MDFNEYYHSLSPDEKKALAVKLETSVKYLAHLASGFRKAGGKTLAVAKKNRMGFLLKMLRPELY